MVLDNLKSLRFSSAALEGLITSPLVSGWELYAGDGRVPNRFTWAITANEARLSKDFAQRSVPIWVKRARYAQGWYRRVCGLIDARRWEIVGDLLAFFRRPPKPLPRVTRWEVWETDVVARLPDPAAVMDLIAERQGDLDADTDSAELVRAAIVQVLKDRGYHPATAAVRFKPDDIASIVRAALNRRDEEYTATCTYLATLPVTGLVKRRSNGVRFWEWRGPEAGEGSTGWVDTSPCTGAGTDPGSGWRRRSDQRHSAGYTRH